MNAKTITKTVLYGFLALTTIFLSNTEGFTAARWGSLDWFQLLTLALKMNGAAVLVIVALLDNPGTPPPPPVK